VQLGKFTLKEQWWWYVGILLVLVAAAGIVYWPSLSYPFEFDDHANILKYFNVRHNTFSSLFLQSSRWVSYWLNAFYYSLLPAGGHYNPMLYRAGNILFHIITGLFVFTVIRLMAVQATRNKFLQAHGLLIATLTAGFFLLHPVSTQTVSYVIQGQLEGIAGLFMLAMLACFLAYTYSNRTVWLILLYALIPIACGTKEIVIITPIMLMVIDWFFVAQGNWYNFKQRRWLHLSFLGAVLVLYIYLLKPLYFLNILGLKTALPNNIGNMLTPNAAEKITPYAFFISQFKVILHYVAIFVWPWSMSVDYDWKLSKSFFAPDSLLPFLFLCCVVYWLFKRLRRNPIDLVSFGVMWFLVAVLPRSSIVPSTELLADYKTYFASVGLLLLAACGVVYVWDKILQRLSSPHAAAVHTVGLVLLLLAAFGLAAYHRNTVWQSPEAFWENIILNAPAKARAYNNYGVALCEKRQYPESVAAFSKAIQLDATYPDPHNNIAVAYVSLRELDKAVTALQKSIALVPYQPETYNNLATVLMQKNDYGQVEQLLRHALTLRPHYGKAYRNLGVYYAQKGDYERAWQAHKDSCCKADYDNIDGFYMYAQCSAQLKKYDDALIGFQRVLAIDPGSFAARANLIQLYRMMKRPAEAEQLFQQTMQMPWSSEQQRTLQQLRAS